MCQNKQTCYQNCNLNGICINGMCLCTGELELSFACDAPDIQVDPLGGKLTGGRTLFEVKKKKSLRAYNIEDECQDGFVFDPIVQECLSCQELLSCDECNESGCLNCEYGTNPVTGECNNE